MTTKSDFVFAQPRPTSDIRKSGERYLTGCSQARFGAREDSEDCGRRKQQRFTGACFRIEEGQRLGELTDPRPSVDPLASSYRSHELAVEGNRCAAVSCSCDHGVA